MEISVRSYLTAGTVAVVGAGAIALAPVVPATSPAALGVPAPAVADVALTAFSFSLSDVLGLLGNFGIGGALPDVLGALPSLLPGDIVTAVVTEFVNQAGPLVTAAASEVFGYLGTAVIGLLIGPDSIPSRFGGALADIPVVLATAVGSLTTGDIAGALQTITTGLAAPITGITQAITDAAEAFQTYLATQFNDLLGALPGVLLSAVQTVLGGNLQSLIDTIGGALSGLFGGLIPAASVRAASVVADVPAAAAAIPASASVSDSVSASVSTPDATPEPVTVTVTAQRSELSEPAVPSETSAPALQSRVEAPAPAATADEVAAADTVAEESAAPEPRSAPAAAKASAKASAAKAHTR